MKKCNLKRRLECLFFVFVISIISSGLVACGNKKAVSGAYEQKEFIYVPEYISLGEEENSNFYNMCMSGNSIYFTHSFFDEATQVYKTEMMELFLETHQQIKLPVSIPESRDLNCWTVDAEKNIYTVEYSWGEPDANGNVHSAQYLCKYDTAGNIAYEQDITEILASDENNSWVSAIAADGQGRVYMTADNLIRLFDTDGSFHGAIEQNNGWVQGLGTGKDGIMYISYYDTASADGGMALTALDFDGKKLGQTYTNFPNSNGNGALVAGVNKDFLVSDSSKVYEYDIATQTYEVLMEWLDSDINGTYVSYVCALADGRLVVLLNDWDTGKAELAYLTKTATADLPEKQQLVIGTLYDNQAMQAAAVEFNKNNENYHVNIKTYIDSNNWTENSWQDGITALNNDILSRNNCPDILDLSSLNLKQLAAKGALEDLSPYLEKSTVVNKEDYLESVIRGYTFDDKLVCIPNSISLSTMVGKTAQLGSEQGWTVEEMMAFAQEHPEAALLDGYTKESMISVMLQYNQNAFVDWATGKCGFDSDEFKQLLTFANTLPAEYDWAADDRSTPTKIQAGEVLLNMVYIYELNSIQEYEAMFNEPVTYIGYPNSEGTSGCYFTGDEMYGIASKSGNKEGAWAFVESCLTNAENSMFSWGLYTNKQMLEEKIAEETKVEYVLDENGEPVLDENGEPIIVGEGSGIGYGDWEYTYHIPTQEEVDTVMALLESAVPAYSFDNEIFKIIEEEAEGYFQGQKTVDDVAGIIQSRVQIYVNENS